LGGHFKLRKGEKVSGKGDRGRGYHGKEGMMGKGTSGKGGDCKKVYKINFK